MVSAFVFLVISAAALAEAYRISLDPLANRLNQALVPGMYLAILGVMLLLSGVVHLIQVLVASSAKPRDAASEGPAASPFRVLAILAGLVLYAVLLGGVGYLLASLLFFLGAFVFFGVRSWLAGAALSVALTVACYIVFVQYLRVLLPRGLVESLL